MVEHNIYWSDLNEQAQERLNDIYHENIELNPLAIIEMEETTHWAVIRLEAKDEQDEDTQNECDDFEFDFVEELEADKFLKSLRESGDLVNSGYVGNAYFLETKNREDISKFAEILLKETKDTIPKNSTINIEWDYYPDWADEIIKQSEEDDEEN